ncbi:uncharacterized protein I206_105310 [Kwoniella pini CBS 10737]|uniref:Uncharacterized protein n=1 Tax=Kwoniella pini CBS 10737 TaxID=1296096 RepID=A0A1B9I4K7_9TREE|nr:uncharacterized protein I206_03780 [Kwoniella pini CBS 10737]OCF50458.1 hypothetical protein I206_03780 [Kwoniella pini CBS 10737]
MPPTSIEFTPKHSQPFTLEEAMGLEIETLVTEIKRLENSIKHLKKTQIELKSYINSEDGNEEEGEGEIELAYKENENTISSQSERITIIKLALINKLGSDARLEHYGLSIDNNNNNNNNNSKPLPASNENTISQQQIRNEESLSIDQIPREIVQLQGGGSAGTSNQEQPVNEDVGLHL